MLAENAELIEAKVAPRDSAEHLRRIFWSATEVAIFTFDLKGRITSWDAGAHGVLWCGQAPNNPLRVTSWTKHGARCKPSLTPARSPGRQSCAIDHDRHAYRLTHPTPPVR
jgi:hypothetical protein